MSVDLIQMLVNSSLNALTKKEVRARARKGICVNQDLLFAAVRGFSWQIQLQKT